MSNRSPPCKNTKYTKCNSPDSAKLHYWNRTVWHFPVEMCVFNNRIQIHRDCMFGHGQLFVSLETRPLWENQL